LKTLIQTRRLFEVIKANEEFIFLGTYFKCEQDICNKIKILQSHPVSWKEIKQEDVIQMVEKKLSVSLHHQQKEAVKEAVNSKVMVITGGPGTGKTTIVRAILAIQKARGLRIKLAAPTGRAAKRLSESCKTEATTIHRLLEFALGGVGFYYNEEKLLQTDMVIIDEASMIDVILMDQVLKALPETCSLVLVGDIDQLPSVGVGNVLKDIIESNTVQIMRLTEIFRQEKGSMIIANAHLINQGLVPQFPTVLTAEKSDFYFIKATRDDLYKKILYLLKQRIPEKFNLDPIHDVQILSPMQKGGSGAYALNIALQHALNSNATEVIESNGIKFSPGDKVMQISNNYDLEVFNGDIGFVKSIDSIEQEVTVTFENREVRYEFNALDQLSLAYAITIHKSQGSEFPVVIIPLLMQHFVMLKRNLLYTAVTRGKHLVIIVGEEEALTTALVENKAKVRYTMLRELLSTN
jgi:exodeoxyribonuclease V alpha subunit